MSQRTGQLRLGAFLYPTGHHIAAWRHPHSLADAGSNFRHYVQLAQAAEAAKFDLVFLADGSGTRGDNVDFLSRTAHSYVAQFEPLTLLSALAAVTERIGLVGTASTTFNEPYHIARKFASLDHISGGRAGWNLVTSSSEHEAKNFNFDEHLAHARRYERAVEFADVVSGLWDSWDEDAFLRDKDAGRFFDPAKRHVLNHRGEFFKVRGPLNVARAPQGHPVVVQAGSSEAGKALAARTAEVIFTAQQTTADAVAFYADVKGRLAQFGREPDDLKIMPGVMPIVGRTESEARDKFAELQALIDPAVGLAMVSTLTGGFDLSGYPLDGPIPELPETNASKSRQALTLDLARRENLTIRELYLRVAGARGHWQVVGTPQQIADALEERFVNYGADGYNVMPALLPDSLNDFIELVLPELRRRGLFRSEYEGGTLRANLGLKRPQSRYRAEEAQTAEA
ncbi:LLM class flavin-dependent oxidoreductase [Paraburkholderia caballeronis]|uniref:FMN-dependent oxidoreductase, nitrilotriacetate monooxygenase family n=1 Tax=Paraburkholderia caballeronis TaxID=416943 RepID=A0A1H7S694_9BURK|nr:LLM class flavin-dependent oxidoreductase [Paraburkholderia caballeronis]PXW22911.1 FMN-dependent oxidoreductase (nitrilotriacetate monooxygenase family) [Paraburkholderia caballeronis]PXW97296.1 FMN-dependent oxidoreductase (nitrilotriacetate monooxygenase family) [Paraburkholderia caballeronis]RAJ93816.1 FMN-dependent oxidoreductase (nitrilotriacetate monooxygenase family) [Paraburkholderia caballeronis]TDV13920.1 FMN-dependent oxidoreductase (nitrilotriacetate monooxygenase family) [Parab